MYYKVGMQNEHKQDARIKKTRQKVLDAGVVVLFTEGWNEITHLRLAAETGVGRGTIYRHWPSTDDLILEIFENCDPTPYKAPRVGDLRADLIAELQFLQDNLRNSKLGDIILSAAQNADTNDKIRKIHQNLHKIIRDPFIEILRAHGFEKNCDDLVGQRLVAPVLYGELFGNGGISVSQIVGEAIKEGSGNEQTLII